MTAVSELRADAVAACRDLVVEYGHGDGRVRALDDVTLEVGPGERLALRGRSGSGKTTLLHALGGLVQPTAGEVELEGRPLATLDEEARRRIRASSIAYVFQGANLLPTFTSFENVAFAIRATSNADAPVDPLMLLRLVGLDAKAEHLPGELSGGERQRVALARALGQHPALLLCDEPTGQLDSDTGARILDLVDALQREFSFALVTATHDENVAARHDRVLELEEGRLVGESA
ncbi:MAG: putative transport system ATP-binding protein [Gaiellaceae bacterium]|jgi:predicted ABC-type transport system involved in lysophospholipase L1 biosynthesis ATPase subunit|nr:putative transport system ATP-binding protein [Gaiellaceae bacterium]